MRIPAKIWAATDGQLERLEALYLSMLLPGRYAPAIADRVYVRLCAVREVMFERAAS